MLFDLWTTFLLICTTAVRKCHESESINVYKSRGGNHLWFVVVPRAASKRSDKAKSKETKLLVRIACYKKWRARKGKCKRKNRAAWAHAGQPHSVTAPSWTFLLTHRPTTGRSQLAGCACRCGVAKRTGASAHLLIRGCCGRPSCQSWSLAYSVLLSHRRDPSWKAVMSWHDHDDTAWATLFLTSLPLLTQLFRFFFFFILMR